MQNHHRTHRRNSVWGLLFSLILLLSLAGCGGAGRQEPQDETPPVVEPGGDETPPSPFDGDEELNIYVGYTMDNVVEIHGYPSDNVKRLNYQDIAEELPAILDDINWDGIMALGVYLYGDEAVQKSVIDLLPELPAEGRRINVDMGEVPWPERLSGKRMSFSGGDLRRMWTESYPQVTDLRMWSCKNVTAEAFRDTFPNLRALQVITGNMNGWDLVMPDVERAALGNCAGLTFEMLAACFPNLKELQLAYTLFPEDLEQISRTGIESLDFFVVDPRKKEEWAALEGRYDAWMDTYDLSVDADREALCALLPYSAQQIKTCCLDHGMEVSITLYDSPNGTTIPDPLELSPGP